jgi:hypothetical protein
VGDQRLDPAALPAAPPRRTVSLINLDLMYGLTDRLSLDFTLPFSIGSAAVVIDPARGADHFHASGLGDVSLLAEYWLSNPAVPSRVTGSVGLGFKAPTGNDNVQGTFLLEDGEEIQAPVDESAQLGTGGWEILLRAQGTAQIGGPFLAYASGYYGLTFEDHTDVTNHGALRAVPDTYSGRLGAAYLLPKLEGFVVSLGGRINGVTVRDIIGGGDPYWRRPGYVIYAEPGLTWTLGASMASLSVPVRLYANKLDSLLDRSRGEKVGASFAPYLLLASYARRF